MCANERAAANISGSKLSDESSLGEFDQLEIVINTIVSDDQEKIEYFTDLLLNFERSLAESSSSEPAPLSGELPILIEILFRKSEAYEAALKLYRLSHEIKGAYKPGQLINALIAAYTGCESESQVITGSESFEKVVQFLRPKGGGTGEQ